MKTTRVRLTKEWAGYGAGSVAETNDEGMAVKLVSLGYGDLVEDDVEVKREKTAADAAAKQMKGPDVDRMVKGSKTKGK
jgi:hypothetical protein